MQLQIVSLAFGIILASAPAAHSQPSSALEGQSSEASDSAPLSPRDLLQAAHEFHQASEALERFGAALGRMLEGGGKIMVELSENVAAASSEFDPFGFKNAFRTIQQQNAMIDRQNEKIQRLQQREIRRLRKELRRAKRRTP